MQKIFQNLFLTFFKKAAYGVAGMLASALIFASQYHPPTSDKIQLAVWSLISGACVGLAAVIRRVVTFDPVKAGIEVPKKP